MIIFSALLTNEFKKYFGNIAYWVTIAFPCIWVLVIFFFVFGMSSSEFTQRIAVSNGDYSPYNYFYKWTKLLINFFIIPYYLILVIYLIDTEHRNLQWKYILTLPFDFGKFILSKLVFILISIFIGYFILSLSFIVANIILEFYKPDFNYQNYSNNFHIVLYCFFKAYLYSFISILLILLITLKFKNYGLIFITIYLSQLFTFSLNPFTLHSKGLNEYYLVLKNDFHLWLEYSDLIIFLSFLVACFLSFKYSRYFIPI
jgi:hypothetical protein